MKLETSCRRLIEYNPIIAEYQYLPIAPLVIAMLHPVFRPKPQA